MAHVTNRNGDPINFDAAVMLMDNELREQIHRDIAPCTEQEFFEAYAKLHNEKYSEGFAPYTGSSW